MLRALFALFLSLMLTMTSLSTAVAKGAPAAVDKMVICTGFGATIIYTDAEGQPTTAPHLCPDCVVHVDAGVLPMFAPMAGRHAIVIRRSAPAGDAIARAKPIWTRPVRGPPVLN